ncbi:ATP-grasp domain-containing protein [Xanthomonas phaseoli]|uniref:ATP-grasp domain-containing protein n=1 Tax=Xanthomonas manihotis TaxID=43353 RepID=A0A8I1XPU6_XANMN|nr:hypothetical protein [Xanthomonas phaseoli]KUF36012.1 hypothetical protein AO826_04635 [Xanthomonas phaseoli pv. manihotis]MBO9719469.1 hypothetical protein [Xanthomonas phaseoli pv. manihotis]MBO9757578.1 hypothetical protein [Xanthomonas phaseoli pv. manihotis]MBO9759789.1 hypothetical protein [Xanthomonas phaseoli pv. manihotis]MBO9765877.1 hypothetical protein [Xanthomonas phaseoli pv. manihotis]
MKMSPCFDRATEQIASMQKDPRKVLIVAPHRDTHASTIAAMIAASGHTASLLDTSQWPCGLEGSLLYGQSGASVVREGASVTYDAAWSRRLMFNKTAPAHVHDQDTKFIKTEGLLFDLGAVALLGAGHGVQRWVNAPLAALAADQKPLQLAAAIASGLVVPETLISQCPGDIQAFRQRHANGVVVKPFNVGAWADGANYSVSYATRVSQNEPLTDADLRACPTTYQQVVDHQADLRVVCMGGEYACLRMRHSLEGEIDYRAVRHKTTLRYDWVPLFPGLQAKLDALRSVLGVDFFCADFVVPVGDGEPVFLELNPGGQFLYLDEKAPGMDIASKFCSFLVYGRIDRSLEFPRLRKVPAVSEDSAGSGYSPESGLAYV